MDVTQGQVFETVGRLTVENGLLRAENQRLRNEIIRLMRAAKEPESVGDAQAQAVEPVGA